METSLTPWFEFSTPKTSTAFFPKGLQQPADIRREYGQTNAPVTWESVTRGVGFLAENLQILPV
jgi:hypothetical protein